jgi:membrane protein YqaA with SNARE-associated domain
MKLLVATFGVAISSAVLPLINIEAYIAGIGALVDNFGIWTVALIAAAGQTLGKIIWYEIGRSSLQWRYVQRRMERPRWRRQYERVKAQTHEREWAGIGLLFISASVGFPPLAVMAVLAGQLRFHRIWFYLTTFVGRTLRFAAVLGGVAWLSGTALFH